MELAGRRAFVTGATGFIGGRLVEKLTLEYGIAVRALVRDFRKATWLSRTSAEIFRGDITDPASLREGLSGCSLVFHCAASTSAVYEEAHQVNVIGTRHLLEAALEANVERFVLVSTAVVHKPDPYGSIISENTPFVGEEANVYARTKLAGEQLALRFGREHGLAVVVLRPTLVYGPRSLFWTINYASRIAEKRLALWPGMDGENNFVYVDDVVQAMILAATAPVAGEAFIIGSAHSTRWSEYLGYYAAMSGTIVPTWPRWLLSVSAFVFDWLDKQIILLRQHFTYWKTPLLLGLRAIRRALRPWRRLERWEIHLFSQHRVFDISKAQRLLGYRPRDDMTEALHETETWLRAQGYLPGQDNAVPDWPAG